VDSWPILLRLLVSVVLVLGTFWSSEYTKVIQEINEKFDTKRYGHTDEIFLWCEVDW